MRKKPASKKIIDSIAELLDNVRRFATTESPAQIRNHRLAMLSRGRNLVWLRTDNASMFAPSRFVGYKGAKLKDYLSPKGRDGTETTPEIDRLMRADGIPRLQQLDGSAWQEAEEEYVQQCKDAGLEPTRKSRSYWVVDQREARGRSAGSQSRKHGVRQFARIAVRQSAEPVEKDIARLLEKSTNPTETLAMVAARVGQGLFRTVVSRRWGNRCAVSGCSIAEALRASHIKPWAESSDDERLDPDNGILLAAHVDALFDRYLVSFQGNGKLVVSPLLSVKELKTLGISPDWRLSRPLNAKQRAFLTLHRREMKRREIA